MLAAAMLVLGCITAAASDYFQLDGAFVQLLGAPSQAQLTQLEISGCPIDQSQTVDGVAVTIQGVVGDRRSAYILFSVELPQDYTVPEPMPGESPSWFWFGSDHVQLEAGKSMGYHIELISQQNHRLQFYMALDSSGRLQGKRLGLTLAELRTAVGEDSQLVAAGPWEFSFLLEYTDNSVKIPLSGAIEPVEGSGIRVTEMRVSPLSIQLECRRPISCLWDREKLDTTGLSQLDITLHFADGSAVGGEALLTGGVGGRGLSLHLTRSYRALMDPQQLTGVQLGDIWIPVGS